MLFSPFLSFAAPISPSSSDFPLTLQCYITGFADSIAYSCTKTWVGFMTGNLTQLSISLSTLIFSLDPRHDDPTSTGPGFEAEWKRIRMSSFSILGFILGCMLSQKLCVMLGDHTRIKLVGASLLRTMITLGVLVFGIVDEGRSLRNSPLSLALVSEHGRPFDLGLSLTLFLHSPVVSDNGLAGNRFHKAWNTFLFDGGLYHFTLPARLRSFLPATFWRGSNKSSVHPGSFAWRFLFSIDHHSS